MMRRLAFALLLTTCALAPVGAAHAVDAAPAPRIETPDPVALEKARKLVDLVLPSATRDKMFETAVGAMMNNIVGGVMQGQEGLASAMEETPELRTVFGEFVERQRSLAMTDIRETMPELMLAYARAYARIFTPTELDDITAFVATPSGAKYVQRSAEILSDPDFAAWQRNVSARSQARLPAEMQMLMKNMKAIKDANGAKSHGS